MAVLEGVPYVTARVRIAGELAMEYNPLDDQDVVLSPEQRGPKTTTTFCYIESKTGAEFAIEVTVTPDIKFPLGHDHFSAEVFIDGEWMACYSVGKSSVRRQPYTIIISTTERPTEAESEVPVERKFVFAPISKNCDIPTNDRMNDDTKRAKTLGTIHVELSTCRFKRKEPWGPLPELTNQRLDVTEKALKGKEISHATSLGEVSKQMNPVKFGIATVGDRKLGEFFFRYRSYQALQHEMIIPRTPSPEPLSGTVPIEEAFSELSESDIRRLALERFKENMIKDESSQLKREADEPPRTPRQWKMAKTDDGKVAVDLTDD